MTVWPNVCAAQGVSDPEKVFDRTANLENTQIINYRVDPAEKWCVLIGIAPGAAERCVHERAVDAVLSLTRCGLGWSDTLLLPCCVTSPIQKRTVSG